MTDMTPLQIHQRSHGQAAVRLRLEDGRVRLVDLRQIGSAKAILPRVGLIPEIVFLNTSGGLTGGDRLSYAVTLEAGLRAIATTQTAERAYRSATGAARVDVALQVGSGGWLDWLPQETILFDAAALDRKTRVDLGPGAGCLLLETVVLGRAAMGENVRHLLFRDRREIWSGDRPLHIEPLSLNDAALAAGVAVLGEARAFASMVMIAPGLEDVLAPLGRVLDEPGVTAAASVFDGRLTLRAMARDGWPLRRQLARALAVVRRGAVLPRVWQFQERTA